MKTDALARVLRQRDVKAHLLHGYGGPCSIGIISHPVQEGELAIRVRVPEDANAVVAPRVVVDGEAVDVFVERDYRPIRALARS
jgi:hypothetical protein